MARKFNFSLQKVLEVRQLLENKQAVQVFKKKEILKSEEQTLHNLKSEKQKAMTERQRSNGSDQKIDLHQLKVTGQYITQLNRTIDTQGKKVADSGKAVKKEITKLNAAVRDKKAVEKLKERHWDDYKKTVNQEYNKHQDEVAIRVVKGAQ